MASIIINDQGLQLDTWGKKFSRKIGTELTSSIDMDVDTPPEILRGALGYISMIRITFHSKRERISGCCTARQLRIFGYTGHLRARGCLTPKDYSRVRRAGFDEVEISHAHAAQYPPKNWIKQVDPAPDQYRTRLFDLV